MKEDINWAMEKSKARSRGSWQLVGSSQVTKKKSMELGGGEENMNLLEQNIRIKAKPSLKPHSRRMLNPCYYAWGMKDVDSMPNSLIYVIPAYIFPC